MKIFKIWNLNFKIYIIYMYVQFQLKNLLVFQLLLSVMCTLLFADFHNNIFEFYRHYFLKRKHFIQKNVLICLTPSLKDLVTWTNVGEQGHWAPNRRYKHTLLPILKSFSVGRFYQQKKYEKVCNTSYDNYENFFHSLCIILKYNFWNLP